MNYARISGALLFVGSAQFIIALSVSEALYPSYSVSQNYISDLGATCRQLCRVQQPSATIFNVSVLLLGALGIVAALCLQRGFHRRVLSVFIALAGLGAVGVGLLPETAGSIHPVVSLITFLFAGLSAITSYRLQTAPQSYLSVVLGAMTLVSLALYIPRVFLGLGQGGMERMIVYPALVWALGFGASLIATTNPD